MTAVCLSATVRVAFTHTFETARTMYMNKRLPDPVTPAPPGNPRSPIHLSTVDYSPNPTTAVGLPW